MKLTNKDNNLLIFCLLIIAIVAFLFYFNNYKLNQIQKEKDAKFLELQNNFARTPILAKSFSIYDITQAKEIYNKNPDQKLPLASLAKTMTVIISLKNSINKEIKISATALLQSDDYGFSEGEKFEIKELAELTLIGSVNDTAQALAENTQDYLIKMNKKTEELGMNNTVFGNATGLDLSTGKAGNMGTAKDANKLANYFILKYPEIAKSTTMPEIKIKSNVGKIYTIKNTNLILDKIPNILFSKTGYTELAGGNLSIIFLNKNNHKIAITLLGSTKEGRFTDMEKLVNLSYDIGVGE